MNCKHLPLAILLILLLCGVAGAADYYLSTTGNDGNSGLSTGQAWANLSHAQGQLGAGDTLHILPGTYYNDSYVPQSNGTLGNPITICAYSDERPLFVGNVTNTTPSYRRPFHLFTCGNNTDPNSDPAEHYNISGLEMWDYKCAFEVWEGSNNIEISDIITRNCSYMIHYLRDCHHINITDCVAYDSYYAPYHMWYDNHHLWMTNISAYNIIDHGFIDFHTNNDNITVRDALFYGELYDGELIYFHGDHGTNDNNTIVNMSLTVTNNAGQEGMDIWSMGHNNYFENVSIVNDDSHAAFRIMSASGATNFIAKNFDLVSRGYHAVVVSSLTVQAQNILLENFTTSGVSHVSYMSDFGIQSSNFNNFIIRNPRGGTNGTIKMPITYPATNPLIVEYTDGTVFEEDVNESVYYTAARSYIERYDNATGGAIYPRNITLRPTSSYLQDVTTTRNANATFDITELEVDSTVSSNPTWVNATMWNASEEYYNVYVGGAFVGEIAAYGHVAYQYTGTTWPQTFKFAWSRNQPFPTDHSKLYYNLTSPILNSINDTRYCAYNRSIVWEDDVSGISVKVTAL